MVTRTKRASPGSPEALRCVILAAALVAITCGCLGNDTDGSDARVPIMSEFCNGVDDDYDGLSDEVPCALYYPCADPATCRCAASHMLCDGGCFARSLMARTATCGGVCVFIDGDDANCGACGRRCGAGMRCADGRCVCAQLTCNGVCTASDEQNCGACGRACPAGARCVDTSSGLCLCPRPSLPCGPGGACVGFDDNNCGACGSRCPDGTHCTGGSCAYR